MLLDPQKRASYDRYGKAAFEAGGAGTALCGLGANGEQMASARCSLTPTRTQSRTHSITLARTLARLFSSPSSSPSLALSLALAIALSLAISLALSLALSLSAQATVAAAVRPMPSSEVEALTPTFSHAAAALTSALASS